MPRRFYMDHSSLTLAECARLAGGWRVLPVYWLARLLGRFAPDRQSPLIEHVPFEDFARTEESLSPEAWEAFEPIRAEASELGFVGAQYQQLPAKPNAPLIAVLVMRGAESGSVLRSIYGRHSGQDVGAGATTLQFLSAGSNGTSAVTNGSVPKFNPYPDWPGIVCSLSTSDLPALLEAHQDLLRRQAFAAVPLTDGEAVRRFLDQYETTTIEVGLRHGRWLQLSDTP